jgi:hypothetical protein
VEKTQNELKPRAPSENTKKNLANTLRTKFNKFRKKAADPAQAALPDEQSASSDLRVTESSEDDRAAAAAAAGGPKGAGRKGQGQGGHGGAAARPGTAGLAAAAARGASSGGKKGKEGQHGRERDPLQEAQRGRKM